MEIRTVEGTSTIEILYIKEIIIKSNLLLIFLYYCIYSCNKNAANLIIMDPKLPLPINY